MKSDCPETRSTFPRVLIVSGTAPGEPGVGGVILDDLVRIVGIDNVHVCWLKPHRAESTQYIPGLCISFHERRYETSWRPVNGLPGEIASITAARLLRTPLIENVVAEIMQRVAAWSPDVILGVLDSGLTVQVMARLRARTTLPVRSIVWDDIATVCRSNQLDRWTSNAVDKAFGHVLQASERIAVICQNMRDRYQDQFGVQCFVLRHGVKTNTGPDTVDGLASGMFRIGFAGSITTPDCVQSLISSLDAMDWRHAGKDVCLRMMGARYQLGTTHRQWIEHLGWRDASEARVLLNECNLLYLPQSFRPDLRPLTELSFPTKLSLYVAARRPVILHAPEYASPSSLWNADPLGPWARSLDVNDVQCALKSGFEASADQQDRWLQAVRKTHEETLSVERFQAGVRELLAPVESSA